MTELSLPKEPSLRKVCVDLCSGLGGFSQAFVNHGWKVVTVDIEPKFNSTVVADITKIDWNEFKQTWLNGESPDVLLASPPCERFSLACLQWPKKNIKKSLEIVGACLEAIAILKPKRWLMENPRARLRWFIGIPPQTIRYSDYDMTYRAEKVTDLWGNIPLPMVKQERRIKRKKMREHLKRLHSWEKIYPHDKGQRALIPLGVSNAVYESVERLLSEGSSREESSLEVANQK